MASYNKVILIGNLTRDPELRYTPKGTAVATFSLAVNRSYTTESGEKREEVSFVDVDAWDRQAETIGQYMKKGRSLLVEGHLKQDTWDDKQTNQKRSKLKVVLESFRFIDSNRTDAGSPNAPAEASRARAAAPAAAAAAAPPVAELSEPDAPPSDDDVPF